MVFAGEAMIFVVDSDEAVGQCDDEDMRKLEALAANKSDEQEASTCLQTDLENIIQLNSEQNEKTEEKSDSNDEGFEGIEIFFLVSHRWRLSQKDRPKVRKHGSQY